MQNAAGKTFLNDSYLSTIKLTFSSPCSINAYYFIPIQAEILPADSLLVPPMLKCHVHEAGVVQTFHSPQQDETKLLSKPKFLIVFSNFNTYCLQSE